MKQIKHCHELSNEHRSIKYWGKPGEPFHSQ